MNPSYALLDLPVNECKTLDEDGVLYTFKKADHAKILLKNLALMQANEGLLTDVVLRSTSKDYEEPFHSILLTACSPTLKQNLTGRYFDFTGGKLSLKGLSTDALIAFRVFLYKTEFPSRQELVDGLRKVAATYGIDSLKKLCDRKSNEQMSVLWNSHREGLLSQLYEMYQKSELTSCLLDDGHGVTQKVHAPVVAAASPVLWTNLANDLSSSEETRYRLKEIASHVLEDFVKYIYTGNVAVNGENVAGLLKAGCGYEIPALARACCDWLGLKMDCFNAVNILWLAREENCKETKVLQEEAKNFIIGNFTSVSEEDEFVELEYEDLKAIIQFDNLNVNCEEEVFNAVAKWVSAEDERIRYLPELLKCTRLENTSPEFLRSLLQHPLIMKSARCVEYVQNVLESQVLFHLQEDTTPTETFYESEQAFYPNQYGFEDAIASDLTPEFLTSKLEFFESKIPAVQTPRRGQRKDGTPDMRFKENRRSLGLQNKDHSPDMRFKVNKRGLNPAVKKDGSADMRFKTNRQSLGRDDEGRPLTKAGTPDRRFKVTRDKEAMVQSSLKSDRTPSTGPVKKDGTPDMRYTINKDDKGRPLTKAGTPDRRFKVTRDKEATVKSSLNSGSTLSTGPVKKDGTPDMRYTVNKHPNSLLTSSQSTSASAQVNSSPRVGGPLKKDGTPDMRYAVNKQSSPPYLSSSYVNSPLQLSSYVDSLGPLKRDGTPDMRYAVNRQFSSPSPFSSYGDSPLQLSSYLDSSGPLKRDGTPDMRYAVNKQFSSPSPFSSYGSSPLQLPSYADSPSPFSSYGDSPLQLSSYLDSSGPLKRDGTPDMRYAVNKQFSSPSPFSSYGSSPLQLPSYADSPSPFSSYGDSPLQLSSYLDSSGPLKRDGTPDMRYAVNRQFSSPSPFSSYGDSPLQLSSYGDSSGASCGPCGPLKKDGTPDMRYKANWR